MPMRVQIQVRIVSDDDTVLSEDVIACFDKGDDQLEEIGLSLEQAKTVLAGAQVSLVAAQATSFLTRASRLRAVWSAPSEQRTLSLSVPHRVRHHPPGQPTRSPLRLPAGSEQDLQPVDGAVYRPHRPGATLVQK